MLHESLRRMARLLPRTSSKENSSLSAGPALAELFRRPGLPDHLYKNRPGILRISNFPQKSHALAVNSFPGLEPQMEAEPIDRGQAGRIGRFSRKPAGDEKKRIGMILIHVPDDSRRGVGQRIGRRASIIPGCDPSHHAEASDEIRGGNLQPVIRKVGVLLPEL